MSRGGSSRCCCRNPQDPNTPCADVMLVNMKMQNLQDQNYPCVGVMLVSKEVVPKANYQTITGKCCTVVDIQKWNTNRGPLTYHTSTNINISVDRESSEDEKLTELVPKDKEVFNFMKPVSSMLCGVVNSLNVSTFGLMGSAGYPTISKTQKDCVLLGTAIFLPFSVVTCGMVHAIEGRANNIDLATTMVIAELAYLFLILCMDAMFFAKAPWFIMLLGLFAWIVLAGWLVQRYGRPKGLYTIVMKAVKKVIEAVSG